MNSTSAVNSAARDATQPVLSTRVVVNGIYATDLELTPSGHDDRIRAYEGRIEYSMGPGHTYLRPRGLEGLTEVPTGGIALVPGERYLLRSRSWSTGTPADLWVLDFGERHRLGAQRVSLRNGDIAREIQVDARHAVIGLAVRVEGTGTLALPEIRLDRFDEPVTLVGGAGPSAAVPGFGDLFESNDGAGEEGPPWGADGAVDWNARLDDRTFQWRLHSWFFLEPHLTPQAEEVDDVVRVVLDWIERDAAGELGAMAWYSHAVAARAPILATLLRIDSSAMRPEVARAIRRALVRHAGHLCDPSHYEPAHNHGLFIDYGLAAAAISLDHPDAVGWLHLAQRRFSETLSRTVDLESAMHLEHSPEYHAIVAGLVERAQGVGLAGEPRFNDLGDRMREVLGWLMTPDGRLVAVGDTQPLRVDAERKMGFQTMPNAGFVSVQTARGSLHVTSAYHGTAHKHLDDSSFVLWHDCHPIVVDSGHPGYDQRSRERELAVASAAHNVCSLSDEEVDWRSALPSGSGLLGYAEVDGLYAALVRNPQLGTNAEPSLRLFLYRPGDALVVIDHARPLRHGQRRIHFAPDLRIEQVEAGWRLVRDGVEVAALIDVGPPGTVYGVIAGDPDATETSYVYDGAGGKQAHPVWTATGEVSVTCSVIAFSAPPRLAWSQPLPSGFAATVDFGGHELGVVVRGSSLQIERWT